MTAMESSWEGFPLAGRFVMTHVMTHVMMMVLMMMTEGPLRRVVMRVSPQRHCPVLELTRRLARLTAVRQWLSKALKLQLVLSTVTVSIRIPAASTSTSWTCTWSLPLHALQLKLQPEQRGGATQM